MSLISVIILTLNEEIHIERCVKSALKITNQVFLVDSFSTDKTVEIAKSLGVEVLQHEFKNHGDQLKWALDNITIKTDWVMRMDADEIITDELSKEIIEVLKSAEMETKGFVVPLYVRFKGALIRNGGYPQWQLRIWRRGAALIEQRWMDEKIIVEGSVGRLSSPYIDDNLNNITWWTNKHNAYSTREAIDLLRKKYDLSLEQSNTKYLTRQARYTRWLKENVYRYMPKGIRAFFFFLYRVIFRLGFLDGPKGVAFHLLQGFWYRFLVDVKVAEVEKRMKEDGVDYKEAVRREFSINL